MPEQNPTVTFTEFAYVDLSPTVTSATVRRSCDDQRMALRLGNAEDDAAAQVWLPDGAWLQVIPRLVAALPEPARSQAIAAVAQLGAEAVSA